MKRNRFHALAIGCVVTLAGCGTTAAVTPPSVPSRSSPAAHVARVPPALATYAQLVRPILASALQSGRGLLGRIAREDYETLSADCAASGPNFSNMYQAFRAPARPSQAGSVAGTADLGFKTVLSSIDECGMAADAMSSSQRKVAARDLSRGLGKLASAYQSLGSWAGAAH